MSRSILILALATGLTAACSETNPPQSTAAGDKPAAPTDAQPTAPPASTTPSAGATTSTAPATSPEPQRPAPTAAPTSRATPVQPPTAESPPASVRPAPAAAATAEPKAPPEPKFRELTIPADTPLSVTLDTPITSDKSNVEDPVSGTVAKAIVVSGRTVVPVGSEVTGSIVEAKESGRVKGRASVVFQFDRLVVRGESHRIQTTRITREAESKKGDDAKKGGIGAGVGAIVGGIAGGGTGAVVGGAVGGTGAVLATKGREVELPAGTTVATRLREPVKVVVPNSEK